jgi:hypothetical protein
VTHQDQPNWETAANANNERSPRPIYSLPSSRESSSESKIAVKEPSNIGNGSHHSAELLEENVEEKEQICDNEKVLFEENGQFENNLVVDEKEEEEMKKKEERDNINNNDDENTNTTITTMTAINSSLGGDTKNNSTTEGTTTTTSHSSTRANSFGCEQLMELIQQHQQMGGSQFCGNVPVQNVINLNGIFYKLKF